MNELQFSEHTTVIEALILASPEPITLHKISVILNMDDKSIIENAIEELNSIYDSRGHSFRIVRGGGGYRFATRPEFGKWVKQVVVGSGRVRLSRAALETLAIIVYKQPIGRSEIENIRGVDVSGVIRMLVDRGLIAITHGNVTGRAHQYVTTSEFLRHFGLDTIEELPAIEELTNSMDQLEADFEIETLPTGGDSLKG